VSEFVLAQIVGRLHIGVVKIRGDLSLEDREGDAGDPDSEAESDDEYNGRMRDNDDSKEVVYKVR